MFLSSRLLYFPSDKDLSISNRYFRSNLYEFFQFFHVKLRTFNRIVFTIGLDPKLCVNYLV